MDFVVALWLALLATRARGGRRRDALQEALFAVGAFLVLTPTLHPWYLTWVMPFLAARLHASFLALIALAPLTYWPLTEWQSIGRWEEPAWLWPAVALPFFLLLALERRRGPLLETDPR